MPQDFLLLSTADWDHPFWTNKQHTAKQLADRGYRVLYVESLGLRKPAATGRDFRRILRRLGKGVRGVREVQSGLWVWSPLVIPLHDNSLVRYINQFLLKAGLRWVLRQLRIRNPIFWTYNPVTVDIVDAIQPSRVVYHCVDELTAAPGMPAALLAEKDKTLTRRSDAVFCTAPNLYESRLPLNQHTYFLPNVADFEHFHKALDPNLPLPSDLADMVPGPKLGFVGALSSYKLDFKLLADVARDHPGWQLVLVGQVGEGDPATNVTELQSLPNVHFIGPRPYSELPAYLKGFDVCLLPNALNQYTHNMFPMKFFEYLAAGKPIVATPLDALKSFHHLFFTATDPVSFAHQVERALAGAGPTLEERLNAAREHTWERRLDRMLRLLSVTEG